jgi:hypothetical protein
LPEDVSTVGFRNVVFHFKNQTMDKVKKKKKEDYVFERSVCNSVRINYKHFKTK